MLNTTQFFITDNSGARLFKGIKVLKKTNTSKINISNKLIGAIHNIKLHIKSRIKKLNKGEIKSAILVRSKNPIYRKDGSLIKFFENSVVLIDSKNKPLATRIKGILPYDLRYFTGTRKITLSGKVIL